MNKVYSDLIYLIGCTLKGEIPSKEKIEEMDLEKLFNVAKYHTLTSITAQGLEKAGAKNENFRLEKEKATRKNIFLDVERNKLFEFCEQNGIWYMPLKGVILKNLYPEFSMRQMSDNDILFDEKFRKDIRKYFENNGYTTTQYEQCHHDAYEKPPVLNFEMHTSLVHKFTNEALFGYYENVKERLVKDDDNNFGYHFTDEDFYIFMLVHEYKHFSAGGTGLRSIVDKYVYLKNKESVLKWDYIYAECQKLGLVEFEQQSRILALRLFDEQKPLCDDDLKRLEYYLRSGTYGNLEHSAQNRIKKFLNHNHTHSRVRYVLHRVFPPMQIIRENYPFMYKSKVLIPMAWAVRLVKSVTVNRKKAFAEINVLKNVGNNKQ